MEEIEKMKLFEKQIIPRDIIKSWIEFKDNNKDLFVNMTHDELVLAYCFFIFGKLN